MFCLTVIVDRRMLGDSKVMFGIKVTVGSRVTVGNRMTVGSRVTVHPSLRNTLSGAVSLRVSLARN